MDRPSRERTFSRRSLHGQVAHELGMQIIRGEIAPGDLLPNEADLSARLKVSRTALREAIKVLAGKGLIESRPKTGTQVRPRHFWNFLDPDVLAWQLAAGPVEQHVRDLFELRKVIEPGAAMLAATRATAQHLQQLDEAFAGMAEAGDDGERFVDPDTRFHQGIMLATGNELIWTLGALIETALQTSFRLTIDNPRGQRHALPLHRDVLEAIRAGNAARAQRTMQRLLAEAEQDVRRALDARAASGGRGARPAKGSKRAAAGGR